MLYRSVQNRELPEPVIMDNYDPRVYSLAFSKCSSVKFTTSSEGTKLPPPHELLFQVLTSPSCRSLSGQT